MDILEKKIHFVQEFLQLNDEELIDKLNMFLQSERKSLSMRKLKPLSEEKLNKKIDAAETDSFNERLISVHKLKSEIDLWK